MSELFFEWDSKKAASNVAKHGVTFEEAKSVFYDTDALIILIRTILLLKSDLS